MSLPPYRSMRYGVVCLGMGWHGVVWGFMVWLGVVGCGVVWCAHLTEIALCSNRAPTRAPAEISGAIGTQLRCACHGIGVGWCGMVYCCEVCDGMV